MFGNALSARSLREITAALAAALTATKATGAEVALARRESHHRGRRHLGLARVSSRELPHTWAAWRRGRVSEWRVTLIARETACLSREHRRQVDAELAGDATRLERMGDREIIGFCRERAAQLDTAAVVARRRHAESERCVTLRPAPDAMVWLTALLPVADGVAAYAALTRAADGARTAGDPRGKGQVMADTLVSAVGSSVRQGGRSTPATELAVVMTDRTLFGTSEDPAWVDGFGVVDPELARELALGDRVRLRRLFADPRTGELVAMDARSRRFRLAWRPWSGCATERAARRGVTRPSATSTMPSPTATTAPRAGATGRGSARRATTPRRPAAGRLARDPAPDRSSRPRRPPARSTGRERPPHPASRPATPASNRGCSTWC